MSLGSWPGGTRRPHLEEGRRRAGPPQPPGHPPGRHPGPLEVKGGGQGRDYWVFTQPLELEEVASVTIAGETFPVE